MHEKVLLNKKNGMAVMLLSVLFYAAAIVGFVFGCILVESGPSALSLVLLIVCAIWLLIGWIPFLGLKVLKPQEALVLTLFGKYVGTLKNDGFYYVNPRPKPSSTKAAMSMPAPENPSCSPPRPVRMWSWSIRRFP